jgi:N-acetyltransferase
MNFSFDEEIILENSFALLRPINKTDIDNLLPVAAKDKDLLQFSPAQIYTRELLKTYIDKAIENRINKNTILESEWPELKKHLLT